jgi:hypothetical protein
MNTQMTIKSILNAVLIPLIIFSLVLAPVMVFADNLREAKDGGAAPSDPGRGIAELPEPEGINTQSLIGSVELVIQWALGFIGIVVFLIFLFAGFEYATAGGDEGKASTAQKRMVNAVIGLIIIFFAFVASNAVLSFIFADRS